MARRFKSLEDQLSLITEKRNKTQILLSEYEKEIESIKQQIDERDMRELYQYVKSKGLTLESIKVAFDLVKDPTKKKIS